MTNETPIDELEPEAGYWLEGEGRSPARHTTDPLALHIFGLLRPLEATDRLLVLRQLRAAAVEGPSTPEPERQHAARMAVQRFLDETGGPASAKRYSAWRGAHEEKQSLPAQQWIARSFGGSWIRALAGMGLQPTLDHSARRMRTMLPPPTDEEMLRSLRECAFQLGLDRLTFAQYRQWAVGRLAAGQTRPTLIISAQPFHRRFGSWRRSQQLAGLDVMVGWRGASVTRREYPQEQLIAWLKEASEAIGVRRFSGHQFDKWRRAKIEAGAADGRLVVLPTSNTVCLRFGTWGKALLAAGLITDYQSDWFIGGQGVRATPEHVAWSLWTALVEVGSASRLTQRTYTTWAQARYQHPTDPKPVSVQIIRMHLGTWRNAVAVATESGNHNRGIDGILDHIPGARLTEGGPS